MRRFLIFTAVLVAGCGDTHAASSSGAGGNAGDGGPRPDPFSAPSACESGAYWEPASPTFPSGSADMYPGRVCLECHANPPLPFTHEGPPYPLAGTVFTTGHVPDSCKPTPAQAAELTAAKVYVKDANGVLITMIVHPSGNFYPKGLTAPVAYPITAWVAYDGRERHMVSPVSSGDCNSCHTEQGANGAPGRIALP